jgi:hypothetical protein
VRGHGERKGSADRALELSLTLDDLELPAIDGIAFVVSAGADDVLAISDAARAQPRAERADFPSRRRFTVSERCSDSRSFTPRTPCGSCVRRR